MSSAGSSGMEDEALALLRAHVPVDVTSATAEVQAIREGHPVMQMYRLFEQAAWAMIPLHDKIAQQREEITQARKEISRLKRGKDTARV